MAIFYQMHHHYRPNLGAHQAKYLAAIVAENSIRIKRLKHKEDVEVAQEDKSVYCGCDQPQKVAPQKRTWTITITHNREWGGFINNVGLMDFNLKGSSFTWFNNPRQGTIVREKIDRVLANTNWRLSFPHALATTFPIISSYHTPIMFDIEPSEGSGCQNNNVEPEVWKNLLKRLETARGPF
ncbi:Endonuclease/exonuclease/phosphatase superfamily [Sesbania bispinosa]|nr:Endonuclease/exonuclease/phosphatase superfamily [Sesbania bispinosa]